MVMIGDSMTSAEYQIDRELEELVAKMVRRTATERDYARYQELAAQRTKLMNPSSDNLRSYRTSRFERRRAG